MRLLLSIVLLGLPFLASTQEEEEETFYPIEFEKGDTLITAQGEKDYARLCEFLEMYESFTIALIGQLDAVTDSASARKRAKLIRERLVEDGYYPDRISIGTPQTFELGERNAGVGFGITSDNYYPCTGLSIVNFDKKTNEIVETRCDSVHFMVNFLEVHEEPYAVIGIYTSQTKKAKKKAKKRAKRIRAALISLGVPEEKLVTGISYFRKPTGEEPSDWPFYPEHYSYEIGVYLLPAIE